MPHSFRIDPEHGVVLFRAEGSFSSEELLGCLQEVVAHPQFRRTFNHLVDLRDVSDFAATPADLRERVEMNHALEPQLDASRIALVATRDAVFGMCRMYEQLMTDAAPTARTFREMREATEWLDLPERIVEPTKP